MSEPPKTLDDQASQKQAQASADGQDDDEAEMTSIMGAEERKVLMQAARDEEVASQRAQPAKKEDFERTTARPPSGASEASDATEEPVVIPRAPALPGEGRATAAAARKAAVGQASDASPRATPGRLPAWYFVAFVMLGAAVVFELMH